jgi:hypothetical protein
MASQAFQEILRAIKLKRPVRASYGGHTRYFCPHVLGYKAGVEHALVYQYDGQSRTGIIPTRSMHGPEDNWRCLFVGRLRDVTVLEDDVWCSADNHSKRQSCVDRVFAEVV